MKKQVRATVVKTNVSGNIVHDFSNLKSKITQNKDSDIIVFSESFLTNFKNEEQHKDTIKELEHISLEEGIIIVVGFDEAVNGQKFNSAYLFEDGNYNVYNKVHLVFDEVDNYTAGNSFPVFSTKIGKIGMMICYDAIFPESARCLRLNGAEMICLLAQWTEAENDYWDIITKVRAKENWVYLLASDDMQEGCGKSCIIGPDGMVQRVKKDNQASYTLTSVLDGEKLEKLNKSDPTVNWTKLRQPTVYEPIIK